MKAMAIYEDDYCIVFTMDKHKFEYFNKRSGTIRRQIVSTDNVLIIPWK